MEKNLKVMCDRCEKNEADYILTSSCCEECFSKTANECECNTIEDDRPTLSISISSNDVNKIVSLINSLEYPDCFSHISISIIDRDD